MQQTHATKVQDIKREWHLVDVKDQTLGRTASKIAQLLMGKRKAYFVRNLDCGDHVVVVNAENVRVSGKKEVQKTYYRHSMYPGGLKAETLRDLRQRRPDEVIRHAVLGMLPQNRLRDQMIKRLHIFSSESHDYTDKQFLGAK